MGKKQAIAIGIALQAQVLKTCPLHRQLYFDDDVNPAGAFGLGTAPPCCPECTSPATH
ncbi:MAG: hypothetical protein ACLPWG_26060 [Steroidobacteraceae bacterium]